MQQINTRENKNGQDFKNITNVFVHTKHKKEVGFT